MVHSTRILVDYISGTDPFVAAHIQERYNFTLHVYDLQEMEEGDIAARLVRRSPYSYQETMNLKSLFGLWSLMLGTMAC
jgi:hypothetical protein